MSTNIPLTGNNSNQTEIQSPEKEPEELDQKRKNQLREMIFASVMLEEMPYDVDEERAKHLMILEEDRTIRERRKEEAEMRIKSTEQRHKMKGGKRKSNDMTAFSMGSSFQVMDGEHLRATGNVQILCDGDSSQGGLSRINDSSIHVSN